MVLNEEKWARLAEVLALREEATTGAGAPALSTPNIALATIAPAAPSSALSTPLDVVPLAAAGASSTQAPLKRVVEIVSDDEADTTDGLVFKKRRVAVAAISHSSSARHPASLRDHPQCLIPPEPLRARGWG